MKTNLMNLKRGRFLLIVWSPERSDLVGTSNPPNAYVDPGRIRRDYNLQEVLFEHRFWLQILGDHSRFILQSLAPKEQQEIQRATIFMQLFDNTLEQAREGLLDEEILRLTQWVCRPVSEFREFKLHLIRRHLQGKISISLPPTFINHMVNELEEYWRILQYVLSQGGVPTDHPVHHHLLWLSDAIGHAGSLSAELDLAERRLKEKSDTFTKHFQDFYLKAVEMAGYLRTNLDQFPALTRFNGQAELEMHLFQGFLRELEEYKLNDEVLGTFSPLMADHMFREECYYLTKLSQVSEVKRPDCNPAKPRVEE